MNKLTNILILLFLFPSCNIHGQNDVSSLAQQNAISPNQNLEFDSLSKVIHVFVALCDNKYQGIVPVPAKIGNGQDPYNNLYWGCAFGVKSFFINSNDWKLVHIRKEQGLIMERMIMKHTSQNIYLVADAYDGQFIKECTERFLESCSGILNDRIHVGDKIIGINGNAKMLAYVGHDGLMDFSLEREFVNKNGRKRDCIVLACVSKTYFGPYLKSANVNPVLWSTGLMSPEAYTLHDALAGYIAGESNEDIRKRAALAYSNYQKCSLKAARGLLVTGW